MIVVFGNFPIDIHKEDVVNFISPSVETSIFTPFRKKGFIRKVEFFILKNKELEPVGLQVLVTIEPNQVAIRTIKVLNNKLYAGKPISVHQYHHRQAKNNKRSLLLDAVDFGENVRKGERRKCNLYILDEISETKE